MVDEGSATEVCCGLMATGVSQNWWPRVPRYGKGELADV